jgi:hypothetical protein
MAVEIHDKLIALLAEVEEFKGKEAALKADKARHFRLKRSGMSYSVVMRRKLSWLINHIF